MALKIFSFLLTVLTSSTWSIQYGKYVQDVRPFMAVLLNDPKRSISFLCGGTIFSEHYVVTVAQCLTIRHFPRLVGTDGVNVHRMRTYHKVIKQIKHPDFNKKSFLNNIGLVKTETKITNFDPPHPYPDSLEKPIFFYGWGDTSSSNKYSDDLKKMNLHMVSDISPCNSDPNARKGLFSCYITDNENDRIGDKGDFGSPVILKARTPTEKNVIIGVMSSYIPVPVDYNGKKYFAMLAANYSYYYPWLAENAI